MKCGQNITLYFNSSEIIRDVIVDIGGETSSVSVSDDGGTIWTATVLVVNSTFSDGLVSVNVSYKDRAGNSGSDYTSPDGQVTIGM